MELVVDRGWFCYCQVHVSERERATARLTVQGVWALDFYKIINAHFIIKITEESRNGEINKFKENNLSKWRKKEKRKAENKV